MILPPLKIPADNIPGNAFGKTTLKVVCVFVAPSASDASLYDLGTTFNADSVALITTGKIQTNKKSLVS